MVAGGDAGLPVGSVHELTGQPGVAAVAGLLTTTVHANPDVDVYPAQAVTSAALGDVLDLDVRHGALARLRSGQVALSEDLAGELGVAVGETAELRLGDGTAVEPTVVATYARSRGFADAVLPMSDVLEHVTDPLLSTVLVRAEQPRRVRSTRRWPRSATGTRRRGSVTAPWSGRPRTRTPRPRHGSASSSWVW